MNCTGCTYKGYQYNEDCLLLFMLDIPNKKFRKVNQILKNGACPCLTCLVKGLCHNRMFSNTDSRLTAWETVHHLIRVLVSSCWEVIA